MIPRALGLLQRTSLAFGRSADTRRHRALARISGALSDLVGTCALPDEEAVRQMVAQFERTLQGTIQAIATDTRMPVACRRELFPVAIEKAFDSGLLPGNGRDGFLDALESFLGGEVHTILRQQGHFNEEELRVAYETVSLIWLNQRYGARTHEGWIRLGEDFLAKESMPRGLLLRLCRLRCLLLKRRFFADFKADTEIAMLYDGCVKEGIESVRKACLPGSVDGSNVDSASGLVAGGHVSSVSARASRHVDYRVVEGLYMVLCENFQPETDWPQRQRLVEMLGGLDLTSLSRAEASDTALLYESFSLETQMRIEMMARCGV